MEPAERSGLIWPRELSLVLLTLVFVGAGLLGWYIPSDRVEYEKIFLAFKMDLPRTTKAALSVPSIAIYAVATVFVLGSVSIQLGVRDKRSAAMYHMLVVMVMGLIFLAFREAMVAPFIQLMQTVSR